MFRCSFHGVLRKYQGCCKKVLGVEVSGCVESISWLFQERFEGVSGVF